MSSQGIGKSIRALESRLGVELFHRTPQGIAPTEVADALYGHCIGIIEEEDRIGELVSAARHGTRTQYFIGRDSRLGDVIAEGVRKYCEMSGASIEMLLTRDSEADQAQEFVDKCYDYRFLSLELDPYPMLPHEPLCTLEYLPAMNAQCSLASKDMIGVDDLRGRTILVEDVIYTPIRILAKMCSDNGFEPHFRAVDKSYIWDLLCKPCEDVTFIRKNESKNYPWVSSIYKVSVMEPALDTQIVLQTNHDSVDPALLKSIRDSLSVHPVC